jgi:hypothetical protein
MAGWLQPVEDPHREIRESTAGISARRVASTIVKVRAVAIVGVDRLRGGVSMSYGRSVAIAAGLVAALVGVTGCLSTDDWDSHPESTPVTSSTALPDRDDFVAALKKTAGLRLTFTVQSDLDNGSLSGTGAADPTAQTMTSIVTVDDQYPSKIEKVQIGNQIWERDLKQNASTWLHIDQAKLPKNDKRLVNPADPLGLANLAPAIGSVEKGSGPGKYIGKFYPAHAGLLPLGAPELTCLCTALAPFTATVDEQGRVTSLSFTIDQTSGKTLKMNTTMAGFDQPVRVAKPTKGHTVEAPDSYYGTKS